MSTRSIDQRRMGARLLPWAGLGLALLGILLAVFLGRHIILPFILALFLTYLLKPLVEAMSADGRAPKLPRPLAAFLVLAAFLGVLLVAALALFPQLAAEATHLSRALLGSGGHESIIARRVARTVGFWRDALYGTGVFPAEVERQLDEQARNFVSGLGLMGVRAVTASLLFFPKLLELIAVPLLTFYMLADGQRLMREARSFLPIEHQGPAADLLTRLDRVLREYVRGQLVTSLFIGAVVSIGLWALGIRAWLLAGTLAFFVEAIPFFGPVFWGTLAVLLALAQFPAGSPLPFVVAAFAIVAQQIDSHVVAPLILGRFTNVHPLLLIFGTLLGASLFGLVGMFLAAPITALAKETFLFAMERVQAKRQAVDLSVTA